MTLLTAITLWILWSTVNGVFGCSSKAPNPIYKDESAAFSFTFDDDDVNAPNRRLGAVPIKPEPINDAVCSNPLPGLDIFNKGKLPSFFSTNEEDEHVTRSIYPLRCPTRVKDNDGYDIPNAIFKPLRQEHTLAVEMTRWYDSIADLVFDDTSTTTIHQWSQASSFFHHQKKKNSTCVTKATSLGVVLLSFKTKSILLNDNAEAFNAVKDQYEALPDIIEADPLPYFKFRQANGLLLQRSAILGGRIIINIQRDACTIGNIDTSPSLVALNTTATIEEMARHLVNKTVSGLISYTADVRGGKTQLDLTVAEWMSSVPSHPAILGGSTEQLYHICDRDLRNNIKYKSFGRFVEYEEGYQQYRRIHTLLPSLTGPKDVIEAITQFVKLQLDKIIPNMKALPHVKSILKRTPDVGRNYVLCTRDAFTGSQKYVVTQKHYIIPYVCTSTTQDDKFARCDVVKLHLIDTVTCITVFKDKNCEGEGKVFSSAKDAFQGLGSFKSYRACPLRI